MTILSVPPLSGGTDTRSFGLLALERWVSHSSRSLSVAPRSARGDRCDIDPMRRGGAKSFVDDLVLGRGVVLSRAATSLRSIETQPWTRRFVCFWTDTSASPGQAYNNNPLPLWESGRVMVCGKGLGCHLVGQRLMGRRARGCGGRQSGPSAPHHTPQKERRRGKAWARAALPK